MLVRFQPVTNIFNEIDSIINSTLIPYPAVRRFERNGRFAGISVNETQDQVTVRMELPGVAKEDVTVNVNNEILTISGERKAPERKENEQWIRNEISYGKFERSLSLPFPVDVEKVSAVQENGVLTIVLPKHEIAKPKQITIR